MFLLHRCLLRIYGLADADGLREEERWAVSSKPRGHPVPNPRPPQPKSRVRCQLGTAQPPGAFGDYSEFYSTFVTSKPFVTRKPRLFLSLNKAACWKPSPFPVGARLAARQEPLVPSAGLVNTRHFWSLNSATGEW